MGDEESLSVPEDMRRQIREAGFDIDAIDDDPSQREAVMRKVLLVKKLRSQGCTDDEVEQALAKWRELTAEHSSTSPGEG